MTPHPAAAGATAVVLDTNAVLDWLLFRDAGIAPLAAAVERGAAFWLACPRMRDELEHTLRSDVLTRWSPDSERVLAAFDRWAFECPAPQPAGAPALRCTDPDDQVFLDLALAQQARWLVTHDRALLRLARRARAAGVQIATPAAWRP